MRPTSSNTHSITHVFALRALRVWPLMLLVSQLILARSFAFSAILVFRFVHVLPLAIGNFFSSLFHSSSLLSRTVFPPFSDSPSTRISVHSNSHLNNECPSFRLNVRSLPHNFSLISLILIVFRIHLCVCLCACMSVSNVWRSSFFPFVYILELFPSFCSVSLSLADTLIHPFVCM